MELLPGQYLRPRFTRRLSKVDPHVFDHQQTMRWENEKKTSSHSSSVICAVCEILFFFFVNSFRKSVSCGIRGSKFLFCFAPEAGRKRRWERWWKRDRHTQKNKSRVYTWGNEKKGGESRNKTEHWQEEAIQLETGRKTGYIEDEENESI